MPEQTIDMSGTLCGICGCIHNNEEFEMARGGARPYNLDGYILELNWVDLICLRTGREFQLSWIEDPEKDDVVGDTDA